SWLIKTIGVFFKEKPCVSLVLSPDPFITGSEPSESVWRRGGGRELKGSGWEWVKGSGKRWKGPKCVCGGRRWRLGRTRETF
ncbi:hypothetical protein NPIL_307761, partial [Nephila pilipes]